MGRIQLFEFTDLLWYPRTFRRMQTDYLQFASTLSTGHKNILPLILKALQHAQTTQIIDLCSGGSGPWKRLLPLLASSGCPVQVTLTDKFPDPDSIKRWSSASDPSISYLNESIDATAVPAAMDGMRTVFEAFHHFAPSQARQVLLDSVTHRKAIGVFDAGLRMPAGFILLVLSPIITVLTYLLITPFIKPRRISRFLWTYLLPVVPLATCWDGIISLLRTYGPDDLQSLADSIQCEGYSWETGRASTGTPVFDFVYLIGYPS
jgi:hypothetical protein